MTFTDEGPRGINTHEGGWPFEFTPGGTLRIFASGQEIARIENMQRPHFQYLAEHAVSNLARLAMESE